MKLDFLEIGTSNFNCEILKSNNQTTGISIEPIDFYLESLPNYDNIIKINAAVSNQNGQIDVFYIEPDDIIKYNLPNWIRGCNSIGRIHKTVEKLLIEKNININIVQKKKVQLIKFSDILIDYKIENIKFLKIDTEGHDTIIMKDYIDYCSSIGRCISDKIQFESNSLSDPNDVLSVKNMLVDLGYQEIEKNNLDSTFILIK